MTDMRNNRQGRYAKVNARGGACSGVGNDMRMSGAGCKELMQKLRVLDFALVDTVLYLNAYPNCRGALDYYHKLLKERKELCTVINEKCGPINAMQNESKTEWNWVAGPWPWEPEAN